MRCVNFTVYNLQDANFILDFYIAEYVARITNDHITKLPSTVTKLFELNTEHGQPHNVTALTTNCQQFALLLYGELLFTLVAQWNGDYFVITVREQDEYIQWH